jgi:hypothetical protein
MLKMKRCGLAAKASCQPSAVLQHCHAPSDASPCSHADTLAQQVNPKPEGAPSVPNIEDVTPLKTPVHPVHAHQQVCLWQTCACAHSWLHDAALPQAGSPWICRLLSNVGTHAARGPSDTFYTQVLQRAEPLTLVTSIAPASQPKCLEPSASPALKPATPTRPQVCDT